MHGCFVISCIPFVTNDQAKKELGKRFGLQSKSSLRRCGMVWWLLNVKSIAALFTNGNIGHSTNDLTIPTANFIKFGGFEYHAG